MSQDFLTEVQVELLRKGVTSEDDVASDDWAKAMGEQTKFDRVPHMSETSDEKMTIDDWIRFYEYEVKQLDEGMVRAEHRKREIRSFLNVLMRLRAK